MSFPAYTLMTLGVDYGDVGSLVKYTTIGLHFAGVIVSQIVSVAIFFLFILYFISFQTFVRGNRNSPKEYVVFFTFTKTNTCS